LIEIREMASENDDEQGAGEEESAASFLTERQIKVLQMRQAGMSQQQIADLMGTTRSNVSILERRAHQNIARAERTLLQWTMLRAPISIKTKAGTDVFDLPRAIFAAADELGIRLPVTSLDIVVQLKRRAPRLFKRRALEREVLISVTEVGEVMVDGQFAD